MCEDGHHCGGGGQGGGASGDGDGGNTDRSGEDEGDKTGNRPVMDSDLALLASTLSRLSAGDTAVGGGGGGAATAMVDTERDRFVLFERFHSVIAARYITCTHVCVVHVLLLYIHIYKHVYHLHLYMYTCPYTMFCRK